MATNQALPHVKLKGHKDSVNFCALSNDKSTLISGSDDASLAVFDTRSAERVHSIEAPFKGNPVTCGTFLGEGNHAVVAAAGSSIYSLDLRLASGTSGDCTLREVSYNSDEINSIDVNPRGEFLAAADDAGEIKIVNLATWQLHKTLRGAHTLMCSAVCFHPRMRWEVFSGSLDCQIVRWDFSMGRELHLWHTSGAQPAGLGGGGMQQMCNPPFVNTLAVHSGAGDAGQATTGTPAADKGRSPVLLAAGKGDGGVWLCDAAWREERGGKGAGGGGRAGKGTTSKPGKGRGKGAGPGAVNLRKQSVPSGRGREEPLGASEASKEGSAMQAPAGVIAELGGFHAEGDAASHGGAPSSMRCGHHAAVSHVAFGNVGSASFLFSGGNDKRVCIWDVGQGTLQGPTSQHCQHICPVDTIHTSRKVNCIAVGAGNAEGACVYVADTSPILKGYLRPL